MNLKAVDQFYSYLQPQLIPAADKAVKIPVEINKTVFYMTMLS